jgi:hypothetical protein
MQRVRHGATSGSARKLYRMYVPLSRASLRLVNAEWLAYYKLDSLLQSLDT